MTEKLFTGTLNHNQNKNKKTTTELSKLYKPSSWIYIYLFLMALFQQKFMTGAMIFFLRRKCSFFDGDVPCRPSYGDNISQFIRFVRVCSHVTDLNARMKL